MQDYNQFVTAINKIFDYLTKLRAGWNNQDNINYIDAIEEFKTAITNNAEVFKQPRRELDPEEIKELEERAAVEAAEEAAKQAENAKQVQPAAAPVEQAPQEVQIQQESQAAPAPQPVALSTAPVAEQPTTQPVEATEPVTAAPIETLSETPIETLGDSQPVEALPQETTTIDAVPQEAPQQEVQPETQVAPIIVTTDNIELQTTEPPTLAIPQINQPAQSAPEVVESIKSVTEAQTETPIDESLVISPPPIPSLVGANQGEA